MKFTTLLQNKNELAYQIVFLMIALLFCTWLRAAILVTYPIIIITLFFICKWRLSASGVFILMIIGLFWLFSFRNGFYIKSNLVSLYYYIPFILLISASPYGEKNYLKMLMTSLTIVAIANDITGFIQYFIRPNDDSFVGIYGTFTVSQNGLSILNSILFFYYLLKYQQSSRTAYIILLGFFLFSSVLGFYGAGMMVLIAAIVLTYVRLKPREIFKLLGIFILLITAVVITMYMISPKTLEYNVAVLKLFLNPGSPYAPRKIVVFLNYARNYPSHLLDFLFGSGPGTFNSRSAFMVNSPTYFNLEWIKSNDQPFYFKNFAYTLWNASNVGPYDGFMNQPFSSLLSLLGEYGLLFSLLLFAIHFRKFIFFRNLVQKKKSEKQLHLRLYQFCWIFTALLIIIDNYIEYPEIIALLLVIIKLSKQGLIVKRSTDDI